MVNGGRRNSRSDGGRRRRCSSGGRAAGGGAVVVGGRAAAASRRRRKGGGERERGKSTPLTGRCHSTRIPRSILAAVRRRSRSQHGWVFAQFFTGPSVLRLRLGAPRRFQLLAVGARCRYASRIPSARCRNGVTTRCEMPEKPATPDA